MKKSTYEQKKNPHSQKKLNGGSEWNQDSQNNPNQPKHFYKDEPLPDVTACGGKASDAQAGDKKAYSSCSQGYSEQAVKNKKDENDAPSREDWEGGASYSSSKNQENQEIDSEDEQTDLPPFTAQDARESNTEEDVNEDTHVEEDKKSERTNRPHGQSRLTKHSEENHRGRRSA